MGTDKSSFHALTQWSFLSRRHANINLVGSVLLRENDIESIGSALPEFSKKQLILSFLFSVAWDEAHCANSSSVV